MAGEFGAVALRQDQVPQLLAERSALLVDQVRHQASAAADQGKAASPEWVQVHVGDTGADGAGRVQRQALAVFDLRRTLDGGGQPPVPPVVAALGGHLAQRGHPRVTVDVDRVADAGQDAFVAAVFAHQRGGAPHRNRDIRKDSPPLL